MTGGSCPPSRREFGAPPCSLPAASLFGAQESAQLPWNRPATVARVYVASPSVHWLKPDLDFERDRAEVEARMREAARKHDQDVRFTGGELLRQDSEVEGWLKKHSPADTRKAEKEAEALKRAALKVVEPTPREITDAMRFYLGVASWLERERANAITVDCFPGLLAKKLPAYPCIAWSKLNDAGYYGVCEGDIRSAMTRMLITPYSGMPGFVTDPVFDTSRNEVIHAHCVPATKLKGIHGPSSPSLLRNHLETAEGAVMQVLAPANETITCARFVGARKLLISTGEVTGNVDRDRGCRTQFRTRVADARKMLENYSSGLHRVIFCGDHFRAAGRMGKLLGFQVVREG
jgi:L-fucose isomerase-like protein